MTILADGVRRDRRLDAADRRASDLLRLISEQGLGGAATRLLLDVGEAKIPAEVFPRFYFKLLWSLERSYHTTFVASATEAHYGYNDEALRIQSSKVDAGGVDIRRLFICRDQVDVAALSGLMLRQAALGIKVRYILRETIEGHQLLRRSYKRVRALDFSIVDGTLAMTTDVNPRTFKINGARLTASPQARVEREEFFDLLWSEAEIPSPPNPLAAAKVPLPSPDAAA
jgi:hypothetical protein